MKGDMKVLGATPWAWWCMMMMVVVFMAASVLGYNNVVFDVNAAKGNTAVYSNFVTELRNKVADPTNRVCGLRTTQSSPKKGNEYITVELKGENTQSVTLGITVTNLYVWGFQDKYDGQLRSTFVSDAPQDIKDNLFKDATIKKPAPFESNYNSLEAKAKTTRSKLQLDSEQLLGNITSVYGKSDQQLKDNKALARFFLMAAQMVSEAVRFKLMEDSIIQGDNQPSTISLRVAIQTYWGKISTSITAAQPTCAKLNPMREIDGQKFITVDEIKGKMGLLLKIQKMWTIDANSSLAQDSDAALPLQTI